MRRTGNSMRCPTLVHCDFHSIAQFAEIESSFLIGEMTPFFMNLLLVIFELMLFRMPLILTRIEKNWFVSNFIWWPITHYRREKMCIPRLIYMRNVSLKISWKMHTKRKQTVLHKQHVLFQYTTIFIHRHSLMESLNKPHFPGMSIFHGK